MSAVTVTNIHKTYISGQTSRKVLKGISLSVGPGQVLGIIGRSGAGKSTLLRCLNGLETPDSGEVLVGGQSLTNTGKTQQQKILQKIGTVFQGLNLLSRRTVLQNIALPLEFAGASPDKITVKTREIATLVGLKDRGDAYPGQLSGGQRQRVAIGRALATDASLLICDEFTSALDPETALEILSLLHGLNQRLGVTIIMVTHNMSVIREICDQVCVMDSGQVVESGGVEKLMLQPVHPVTHSLVRNLFMKDLPQGIQEQIQENPPATLSPASQAVLRLIFSNTCARQPVIASVIEKFHIPLNIISGNIDHVRETAFGSLVVTIPYPGQKQEGMALAPILAHFEENHVSAEILGFIPTP